MNKKTALILGVANDRSLAWSIAQALHKDGFRLGFGYSSPALERRVKPLAESVQADFVELCDVSKDEDLDKLFNKASSIWADTGLHTLVHSVAFANKEDLEGRFVTTTRQGFGMALDVSVYSLIACAQRAENLKVKSIVTLSYYGAEKVIPNYNVMGVAKAALESTVRYLAWDMGRKGVRVNAISAGPVKTLAAAGVRNFRNILGRIGELAPLGENITAEDVGALAAFLCRDEARHLTGTTIHLDSGAHIMGLPMDLSASSGNAQGGEGL